MNNAVDPELEDVREELANLNFDEVQDDQVANDPEAAARRHESIQKCIQILVHACACRDAACRTPSCHKMKRMVQHTKMCKKRVNGTCGCCKQLIALCCYHAKYCTDFECRVPFCVQIRQNLREQQANQE